MCRPKTINKKYKLNKNYAILASIMSYCIEAILFVFNLYFILIVIIFKSPP